MDLSEATEIRKVPAYYLAELARILNVSNQWKDLMGRIPKLLSKENYECEIGDGNPAKFISEHYSLIEDASQNTGRLCSEILLDEWGCSGRVRPALGHLLHLLKKSELYRAADYVSNNILKKGLVERPAQGPPALVRLHTMTQQILAGHYDSGINEYIMPDMLSQKALPPLSDLLNHPEKQEMKSGLPNISIFADGCVMPASLSQKALPPLSDLLNHEMKSGLPNISMFANGCVNPEALPPLAEVLNQEEKQEVKSGLPNISMFADGGGWASKSNAPTSSLPNISMFNVDRQSNFLPRLSDLLHASKPNQQSSSSLSKLNLTTHLQSFTYNQLEAATDNFNAIPLTSVDDFHLEGSGRFLGSGAFGSVHFALGLFDQPVAVKKIYLKNSVLREDDFVLRQFKNEVEVLCDYRHKNLLRLLGFSSDGPAYCLVYEYISGGNLKDRLQKTEDVLTWFERLTIASGIAEAVTYLHTAKTKPLIHRDIKTANVLLDASNAPKLCDFGTLRISSATTTETTKIYGTSAYMAPEANRGDVSVKIDSYSFGVVLLELLTSLPVIDYHREGCDLVTYVEESITDDITPLLDTRAGSWSFEGIDFAGELYKVSAKCLKEKRYRSTMIDVNKQLLKLMQKNLNF